MGIKNTSSPTPCIKSLAVTSKRKSKNEPRWARIKVSEEEESDDDGEETSNSSHEVEYSNVQAQDKKDSISCMGNLEDVILDYC